MVREITLFSLIAWQSELKIYGNDFFNVQTTLGTHVHMLTEAAASSFWTFTFTLGFMFRKIWWRIQSLPMEDLPS